MVTAAFGDFYIGRMGRAGADPRRDSGRRFKLTNLDNPLFASQEAAEQRAEQERREKEQERREKEAAEIENTRLRALLAKLEGQVDDRS